ncbi:MAG: hypothetical protein HY223_03190 [Thaumarchaeota archaeon]|nr:hypothetical protein [Nitrososphaerota archaeon]
MNQKLKYSGLLVILLVFVAVSVLANSLHEASAAKISEDYAHNHITALYKGTDKQVCGIHLCAPGENPRNP